MTDPASAQTQNPTVGSKPTNLGEYAHPPFGDERTWYMQLVARYVPVMQPMSALHDFWGRSYGPTGMLNTPANEYGNEGWQAGYDVSHAGFVGTAVNYLAWLPAIAWTYAAILDQRMTTYSFGYMKGAIFGQTDASPVTPTPFEY
jgi:hypothetical protein